MGTAHKSSTFRSAILLYIDQPTLGVLNFGFIKYVCISEPELYLRDPLYILPTSIWSQEYFKETKVLCFINIHPTPTSLLCQLLFS